VSDTITIADLIPGGFTWAAFYVEVVGFLSQPLVIGLLGFLLAVALAPAAVRSLRSMVR